MILSATPAIALGAEFAGPQMEVRAVTQKGERKRISIATFDHHSSLDPVVGQLDSLGFSNQQFGLTARRSTFEQLTGAWSAANHPFDRIADLVLKATPLRIKSRNEQVLVTSGPFWPSIACFGHLSHEAMITAPWMAPQLRDELKAQIDNGAIMLGIGALTAEQQKSATQILLKHSSHRVQTHDFRLN